MKCLYIIEPIEPILDSDHAEQVRGLIVAKSHPVGPFHSATSPPTFMRFAHDTIDARGSLMRAGSRWALAVRNDWLRPIDPEPETETVLDIINELTSA